MVLLIDKVVSIFLFGIIFEVTACGPGGHSRTHIPVAKFQGDRIPDVAEGTSMASGRYEKSLKKDDKLLKTIISTDIIFADPGYDSDARKAIAPCEQSLIRLADVAKIYWRGKFKLYVKRGYASIKDDALREKSMHYAGRAFDITLVIIKSNQDGRKYEPVKYHMLRNLAGLAYYNAKFSFVEIKTHHIHVSCTSKAMKRTSSRCFHGDAMVRTSEGQSIRMKDVQIGHKLLTMSEKGRLVYSEVNMLMHQNKDMIVDDYIQITSSTGHQITLSSYHLIFVSRTESIFGKDVTPGRQVYVYDSKRREFVRSTVTNVTVVSKVGAFAPLTMQGTIVVDDVYASCYALFPSHAVSHAVFWLWRKLYPIMKCFDNTFLSFSSLHATTTEYHWYADFFRKSMNSLNLFSYTM